SGDVNYIRRNRIARDRRWKVQSEYGEIDITINLSKPEKDPRDIAAAGKAKMTAYPLCQLCVENVGYAGRIGHPARANHRVLPIDICGEEWFFQYSPYVYYNEHCIVFNGDHVPMFISKKAFEKLFDFVRQFPHYFVGSNADLPIVGGSILSHEHFQGGRYTFAMERAESEYCFAVKGYEDIACGIVKWPLSVIRLRGCDSGRLVELAAMILDKWRGYTDESVNILSETDGVPHNTITPIARRRGEDFELDLCLRNNLTTDEHPLGLFHPHAQRHHIKKENIGLIEVMGLAVLPSRLQKELELLEAFIAEGRDIAGEASIAKHADWANSFAEGLKGQPREVIREILEKEVGKVFLHVLEDAGVFKRDKKGKAAFLRFIESLSE
ncbi:MAG: UDP-glucose--hexose-1-phosphate uridylyltransferase, partial [Ruminococcus sp.]|nr:UDP-glucose--hexose-1-phosphate uridylyltransferase [Ruminococcus sp.]